MEIVILGLFVGAGILLVAFSVLVDFRRKRDVTTNAKMILTKKDTPVTLDTIEILKEEVEQLRRNSQSLYEQLQIAQKNEFKLKDQILRQAEANSKLSSGSQGFEIQYKLEQAEKRYSMLEEKYARAVHIQRQLFAQNEEYKSKLEEQKKQLTIAWAKEKEATQQMQEMQRTLQDVKGKLLEAKKREVKLRDDMFKQRMLFAENEMESKKLREENQELENEYKYERDW